MPRVLRTAGRRKLDALQEQEATRSVTTGLQANGPGTSIGNVWSSNKMASPEVGGLLRSVMGSTESGRLASVKALHPASDLGPQRWPDKSANQTLVLQNTDTITVHKPPDLADTEKTWRAQIWLTNLIDCPVIVVAQSTNTTWINPQGNMNADSCSEQIQTAGKPYTFFYSTQWKNTGEHPAKQFQTARMTARSVTMDLNANATSNQGVIYACGFTPNMTYMPYDGGVDMIRIMRETAFRLFKNIRDNPVEEYEDDDAEVEDLVDRFDKMMFKRDNRGLYEPPSGDQTGFRLVLQDWAWNPQQVMQVSPGAYMAKAEEGCYLMLKHTGDTLPYVDTAREAYLSAVVPHTNSKQTSQMNVLGTEGWTMGAICIDGISTDATLTMKVITDLELTARSDSQMAKLVEEAPPLDTPALRHCRAAMGALPDAFPSRDNVLGGIVDWIGGALEKAGVPILSQVAGTYNSLNRKMGGGFTTALDTIF